MLKAFLRSLPDDAARREWAISCGTSLGHLRNSIYQPKPLSAETCVLIEQKSAGQVRRWHLRPADWHRIWPELINQPNAPIVSAEHHTVLCAGVQNLASASLIEMTPAPAKEGVRHAA